MGGRYSDSTAILEISFPIYCSTEATILPNHHFLLSINGPASPLCFFVISCITSSNEHSLIISREVLILTLPIQIALGDVFPDTSLGMDLC